MPLWLHHSALQGATKACRYLPSLPSAHPLILHVSTASHTVTYFVMCPLQKQGVLYMHAVKLWHWLYQPYGLCREDMLRDMLTLLWWSVVQYGFIPPELVLLLLAYYNTHSYLSGLSCGEHACTWAYLLACVVLHVRNIRLSQSVATMLLLLSPEERNLIVKHFTPVCLSVLPVFIRSPKLSPHFSSLLSCFPLALQ